ncbi:MAG: ABC transporter ATP-binding protein [Planctomycetes bacterium]|nr:ABC transporter ATP-binding protein [Planctomycetota bacterium]
MSAILTIEHLNIEYETGASSVKVVRDVSLQIEEGSITGVVGESGSGKSSLFRAAIGLLPPSARVEAKQLQFNGVDLIQQLRRNPRAIRGRRIGMVFQDATASLNPYLRIGTQLAESAAEHLNISKTAARERALDALAEVAVPDPPGVLRRFPHELSGGQRQRVAIAIALIANPELLVADEPTTALDPILQLQIIQLLKSLRARRGLSIVLISHDLGLVAACADRVAVLYAGRVVEEADARAIFTNPRHPYTRALLTSIAPLRGERPRRLCAIDGHPPSPASVDAGCAFAPRCSNATDECSLQIPVVESSGGRRHACLHPIGDRP